MEPQVQLSSLDSICPSTIQKEWHKKRKRARYRLLSIHHDAKFLSTIIQYHRSYKLCNNNNWPVLSNERCGSWYVNHKNFPSLSSTTTNATATNTSNCYFKSTDGHVGTWDFSLKRLNLMLLKIVNDTGGCFIVDSSKRKKMPDSFSRTIPIWASVINQSTLHYARQKGYVLDKQYWCKNTCEEEELLLFTPSSIVSEKERSNILVKIKDMVSTLVKSDVIDSDWILQRMNKPLRPYWITNPSNEIPEYETERYNCIVCISCSNVNLSKEKEEYVWYTPGAADDHESWAKGLTPTLFWSNIEFILGKEQETMMIMSANDIDAKINEIVKQAQENDEEWYQEQQQHEKNQKDEITFSVIGSSGIAIGTRRSGRPPKCWEYFDAVLNVTTMEYEHFSSSICTNTYDMMKIPLGKFYLCCPVKEGKKDKMELEKWMTVAIVFVITNLIRGRKVLVHCAQGMDRSVAVVIATINVLSYFCQGNTIEELRLDQYLLLPLSSSSGVASLTITALEEFIGLSTNEENTSNTKMYKYSGLSEELVHKLIGREGRNILFAWMNHICNSCTTTSNISSSNPQPQLANKESLRRCLHFIHRYHDRASPSRNTMQKLNRYFMSCDYE